MTATLPPPVSLTNSAQHLLDTEHGTLQIMISWPLGWKPDGSTTEDISDVPVIFVLDGNAYFATATDITRRHQQIAKKKAIVVGIGYPDAETDGVYNLARRGWDLTPPSSKGLPQWPIKDDDGHPRYWKLGGAAFFQATLKSKVLPALPTIVPAIPFDKLTKVLFGHSFGGLFALFSLFTDPGVFDVYIAGSPSIWFNEGGLAEHEAGFTRATTADAAKKPRLYINSGTGEGDDVRRKPGESDAEFEKRKQFQGVYRMNGNARELAARLAVTDKLSEVWLQEFALEDHGSAAVVGLQRGINKLLGEWWVEEKE
ncbi:siderophore esterase [Ophiostoma piceae UAMH 11346]|uniref:Siderophore esterase n=1 Tax=Ophiostoma piceae (strain UAMH 11346) TaxID=1262450 RepID=S3C3Z0_OPHP1|nr:siderophore esterase [Ophiostoma piceae UAMH 11346]